MTYLPPENWNQRLISPYWPPLPSVREEARERLQEAFVNRSITLEPVATCYCEGRQFTLICDRDRLGLPFKAKLCCNCSLILTDPRLAEKDMSLYYNKYYHQVLFGQMPSKALWDPHQGRMIFERIWAYDPAKIKDKARVLEIGAGLGNVLQEFGESAREKGIDLSLIVTEYNQECLAAIRKRGVVAVEGACQEVLSVYSEPFDIIILSHVLEHVTDLNGFMIGLKNLTSPETLLYVEVPGILTLHAKPEYDFDFRKYFVHAHSVHYNFSTLKYHLGRFGWYCLTGNEIAYGLFMPTSEIPRPSAMNDLADQVLFYLANLEATFESNNKVAERLRIAESGWRTQTAKVAELTLQKNKLETQRLEKLAQQKSELKDRHIFQTKEGETLNYCFERTKLFSRELTDDYVNDLLKFSRHSLNYELSSTALFYWGHIFCATEYSGYGRLAGDLVDAVLRAVCAISFARARKQKSFSYLEIGVLHGLNFTGLYNIVRPEYETVSFTAIDPFEGYYGQKLDVGSHLPVTEKALRINLARSQVATQDVAIFKGSSSDPTIQTANAHKTFDLIFVDGDHSYDGVKRDIDYYGTLLSSQGLLIIDNYGDAGWPDIARYVDAELLTGHPFLSALRKEKFGRTMIFKKL